MNLEHLRLFVRVAKTNNISLAGQEMSLSPAVASSYISKLEQGLGVRLVHRTTRKVSLTEEGRAFLSHAHAVLECVDAARASVGAGDSQPSGTLRISAPASFGRLHLVPALTGFMNLYPELKLDLRLSDTIVDLVEGGFDVAVRDAKLTDSSLVARKLAPDHRIVCASPDYLARCGAPLVPEDLQRHSCIHLGNMEQWRFQTEQGLQTVKTHARMRTDNGDAMRQACIDGLGIAINSRWSVYKELEQGSLVRVLPDYPLVSDTAIWVVYPSSSLLPVKVRAFIDYFADYFGNPPYWEMPGT